MDINWGAARSLAGVEGREKSVKKKSEREDRDIERDKERWFSVNEEKGDWGSFVQKRVGFRVVGPGRTEE